MFIAFLRNYKSIISTWIIRGLYNKPLIILLIIGAALSLLVGFINLSKYGVDCQIEGARFLLNKESPYSEFLEKQELFNFLRSQGIPLDSKLYQDNLSFRFTRYPVHLPQAYYLLTPFAMLGDFWGYMCYGLSGVIMLLIIPGITRKKENYYILLLLLFASLPFRNNLGAGQFLFFHFGLFLLFDHFMRLKKSPHFTFLVNPILLLLLLSKPTIFFWIILCYPLNKNSIRTYLVTGVFQVLIVWLFVLQTGTSVGKFVSDYAEILNWHSFQINTVFSVFSILFSNWIQALSSLFVLLNLSAFLILAYLKWIKKVAIDESVWMFSCICLSFIVIYHRYYDVFLFMAPAFLYYNRNISLKNNYFVLFVISLVMSKFIFNLSFGDDAITYSVLNLYTTALVFLIHLAGLFFVLRPLYGHKSEDFRVPFSNSAS